MNFDVGVPQLAAAESESWLCSYLRAAPPQPPPYKVTFDLRRRGSPFTPIIHPRMDPKADSETLLLKLNEDQLLADLRSTRDNLSSDQLFRLFVRIIWHSGGEMDFSACDLGYSKGMQEKLQIAWKNQSFKDILTTLYPPRVFSPDPTAVENEDKFNKIRRRVERAWNTPYQGTFHHLLLSNICAMKTKDPYMNICAIVQSSGTGKSRMVNEQAKLVYTLPINVRSKKGLQFAYPLPDDPLCDYLVREAKSHNVDQCKTHYCIFFKHLFSRAIKALEQFQTGPGTTRDPLAIRWHRYMESADRRCNFYNEVVDMCRKELTRLSPTRRAATKQHEDNATGKLRDLIEKIDKHSTVGDDRVKIVVYIDEAHELGSSVGPTDAERTQLDMMCSVLASFSQEPLFVLLLSTQSSLPLLAPPSSAAPSERARRAGLQLLAPITEIPFDCAPNFQVQHGLLGIDDLWKIDYLTKWGRPLWWTMFQASELRVEDKQDSIIEFARMKLLGHHGIHCELRAIPPRSPARVAIIDVLLALDFEPSRVSFDLQTDMVKSHMRIAYSVPQHREYLRSGYSSEPVLAEAAAQQIDQFRRSAGMSSSLGVMVRLLAEPLDATLVDLGQRGEVVMRLLLMQAYMDAVVAENVSLAVVFSRGCHLVTFIMELFSPTASNAILASRPDDGGDLYGAFSSTFHHSFVRFTHFVKAIDDYAVTTEALFAAFARGMAFICHQTQKSVDIAIPVLYDKRKPIQESNMTALLVQVKRRIKGRSPRHYQFSHEFVGLFPKADSSPNRPYITLVAELGVQTRKKPIYVFPFENSKLSSDDTHPRYHITAYGCSDTVYKATGGFNDTFKRLLATRDFLLEHPRKDHGSRSVVMRMKPAWRRGDSFHWVSDEILNPTNPNESETDIEDTDMDMDES